MTDRLTFRMTNVDTDNLLTIAEALNAPTRRPFLDKAETVRVGLKAAATLAREGMLMPVLTAAAKAAQ